MNNYNPNPTLLQVSGRTVGSIERGVFKKTIQGSKHILRCCGIAFSVEALRQAEAIGFTAFEIYDREAGVTYFCDRATFEENAEPVHFMGHDQQRALPLRYWAASVAQNSKTTKPGEVRYTRAAKRRPRTMPRQIDFYSR